MSLHCTDADTEKKIVEIRSDTRDPTGTSSFYTISIATWKSKDDTKRTHVTNCGSFSSFSPPRPHPSGVRVLSDDNDEVPGSQKLKLLKPNDARMSAVVNLSSADLSADCVLEGFSLMLSKIAGETSDEQFL